MSYYTRFSAAVSLDAHILYDIHTSLIAQSEIRAMTLECARIGGIGAIGR